MPSIKTQDLYRALITEEAGVPSSGDVNFTVSSPPTRTNGFLVLSPENASSRETVYYHDVIGNRIYVRSVNRKSPKFHAKNDLVQMNDVEEIFNFYSDMTSPLFYVEKTGGLTVKVWGGTTLVNRTQQTVADTNLTLTDNTTNYIVYDYVTNVVSVNTTGVGLVKATAIVVSGLITSITYNTIKESYADPFIPDTSLVAPVIQNNTFAYTDSTGSANAYVVSYTPAPTAYVAGQKFFFKANFQNTGSATLNVNGLGAKTIKKLDGATDLQSTDIANGAMVEVLYDGTNFQLTSIPQTIKNNDVTQLTSLDNLTSKASPVGADKLIIGDSQASGVNKKIDVASLFSPFGNGSDGDVTISTNTTLVRDMYYRNLTINSTIVLNPNGYRIYVAGTLTNNGIIRRNGNPGNNSTSQTGGLAGATLNQGSLNAESAAGNGGNDPGFGAGNGVAGASSNPSYTTINGVSGGGNQSYSGGVGGVSVRGALYNIAYSTSDIVRMLSVPSSYLSTVVSTQYKGPSGSGGGAGQSYVGGGGAGSNGGAIWIAARIYSGASGTIEAIGGSGGSGWSYASYGGGGGGGGQGGLVVLIYETLIAIGTVILTGGVGGASGGGLGGSVNGANGNAGVVIQIPITL